MRNCRRHVSRPHSQPLLLADADDYRARTLEQQYRALTETLVAGQCNRALDTAIGRDPQPMTTDVARRNRYVLHAAVRDGYAVAENGLLGILIDPFGEKIAELRAPFAGVVNYVVTTPPMNQGEPVAMISRIATMGSPGGDDSQ